MVATDRFADLARRSGLEAGLEGARIVALAHPVGGVAKDELQRRADAVARHLSHTGVSPGRLTVVSYGEERPAASGSGEVAWSANRRAEFRVLTGSDNVRGTIE